VDKSVVTAGNGNNISSREISHQHYTHSISNLSISTEKEFIYKVNLYTTN